MGTNRIRQLRRQHPRRDDRINRRRVETLERRANFLETRIDSSEGSAQYDEAEYHALRWAIDALREWMHNDPYWVFEPHPEAEPGDRAGGSWRELRHAYWDQHLHEWMIRPRKTTIRRATEDEIIQAKAEGESEYSHEGDE